MPPDRPFTPPVARTIGVDRYDWVFLTTDKPSVDVHQEEPQGSPGNHMVPTEI